MYEAWLSCFILWPLASRPRLNDICYTAIDFDWKNMNSSPIILSTLLLIAIGQHVIQIQALNFFYRRPLPVRHSNQWHMFSFITGFKHSVANSYERIRKVAFIWDEGKTIILFSIWGLAGICLIDYRTLRFTFNESLRWSGFVRSMLCKVWNLY